MKEIIFLIWIIATLLLTISIVGMLLFISDDSNPSTWMSIGRDLVTAIVRDNK